MDWLATLLVWILGAMFVVGMAGATLVLLITAVEDARMLFEKGPAPER
ncbi:MAG TPA: hypothetical protein VNK82_01690 [Terriglobales bacterium]|nr:hypothetical protein [Terriglobales bacterium]